MEGNELSRQSDDWFERAINILFLFIALLTKVVVGSFKITSRLFFWARDKWYLQDEKQTILPVRQKEYETERNAAPPNRKEYELRRRENILNTRESALNAREKALSSREQVLSTNKRRSRPKKSELLEVREKLRELEKIVETGKRQNPPSNGGIHYTSYHVAKGGVLVTENSRYSPSYESSNTTVSNVYAPTHSKHYSSTQNLTYAPTTTSVYSNHQSHRHIDSSRNLQIGDNQRRNVLLRDSSPQRGRQRISNSKVRHRLTNRSLSPHGSDSEGDVFKCSPLTSPDESSSEDEAVEYQPQKRVAYDEQLFFKQSNLRRGAAGHAYSPPISPDESSSEDEASTYGERQFFSRPNLRRNVYSPPLSPDESNSDDELSYTP